MKQKLNHDERLHEQLKSQIRELTQKFNSLDNQFMISVSEKEQA